MNQVFKSILYGTHHQTNYSLFLDIDECIPTNDCMQQCTNSQGSYNCSCDEYFKTDPTDWRTCIGKSYHEAFFISPWLAGLIFYSYMVSISITFDGGGGVSLIE